MAEEEIFVAVRGRKFISLFPSLKHSYVKVSKPASVNICLTDSEVGQDLQICSLDSRPWCGCSAVLTFGRLS